MKTKKIIYLQIAIIILLFVGCSPKVLTSNRSKTNANDTIIFKFDLSDFLKEIPDKNITDYHSNYGIIKPNDFPVKQNGWDINNTFNNLNIQKEDVNILFAVKRLYTGRLLSEHLMNDNKTIYVWHDYKDEPIIISVGETNDGNIIVNIQSVNCGNSISPHSPPFFGNRELYYFMLECINSGVKITYTWGGAEM
jgi:hypothetical protein